MTLAGLVFMGLLWLGVLVWVLNLVRIGRLYVGYGVLFALVLAGGLATLSLPPLARGLGAALSALFSHPWTGAAFLGFSFLLILLVYVLSQLTIVANRLSVLIQELAIREAGRARALPKAAPGGGSSPGGEESPRAPAE